MGETTTIRVSKRTLRLLKKLRRKLGAKLVTGDEHFKDVSETM
jgi:hypothetical protein